MKYISYIDSMNNVLNNIDEIRRKKGYSQEYIAHKIGMKQSGFSLIMSGERELKYNTLLQIANALQESIIDIISYPDKYVPATAGNQSAETILQIKLDNAKRDEIFKIVFGEKASDVLKGI